MRIVAHVEATNKPMVDKNFCISNWQPTPCMLYCYRNSITNSAKGGDYDDENLYLSDCLHIACSMLNVRFFIVFDAHPMSGVLFVCQTSFWHNYYFMHPLGCFCPLLGAFFVESPRVWVKRKIQREEGGCFMMPTLANIFEPEERRRCPWRD